jgi:DNA replication protein DnaC
VMLDRRLTAAGFEERVSLDGFDWQSPVQLDRRHLQELFTLQFLADKQHVLLVGPVGVGKAISRHYPARSRSAADRHRRGH